MLTSDRACMQVLGACLLRTLEQVMGKRWSLDEREAWLAVFSLIGKFSGCLGSSLCLNTACGDRLMTSL